MIKATVTGSLRRDLESPYIATFTAEVRGDAIIAALVGTQRSLAEYIKPGIDIWGEGSFVNGTHFGYDKVLTFDHIQLFNPLEMQ
jgi:hypothetical protein